MPDHTVDLYKTAVCEQKPHNHKASQSSPDSIRMQSKYEDGLWRFWARKLLIEVKEMEFSIQIVLFAAGLIGWFSVDFFPEDKRFSV